MKYRKSSTSSLWFIRCQGTQLFWLMTNSICYPSREVRYAVCQFLHFLLYTFCIWMWLSIRVLRICEKYWWQDRMDMSDAWKKEYVKTEMCTMASEHENCIKSIIKYLKSPLNLCLNLYCRYYFKTHQMFPSQLALQHKFGEKWIFKFDGQLKKTAEKKLFQTKLKYCFKKCF